MPLTAYNRVQINGSIGTHEIWSCGLNFATTAGEAIADDQAALTTWANAIRALNSGDIVGGYLQGALSTALAITGLRVSAVSGSTHRETAAAVLTLGTPIAGVGGVDNPQETAVALSLLTGTPGRRYRGRVYWPAVGLGVGTNMRFDAAHCAGLASNLVDLINGIITAAGDGTEGAGGAAAGGVLSGVVVSRAGGLATSISAVSVGDVPDVQRRRRNHEQEVYSVHAVA